MLRAALALALLLSQGPPPEALPGIPADGEDIAWLDDGRVLRAKVGEKKDRKVPLTVGSVTLEVPERRVERVRWFRDYDSTPRNEEEKSRVASGQVRVQGQWYSALRAGEVRAGIVAEAEERRLDAARDIPWASRRKVKIGNILLESNLPRRTVEEFTELLKDFGKFFASNGPGGRTDLMVQVLVYRDRRSFEERKRKDMASPGEHVVGYCVTGGERRIVLFLLPEEPEQTARTLLHEMTHLYMSAEMEAGKPIWLSEGLAEYFSVLRYRMGQYRVGGVQEGRLQDVLDLDAAGKLPKLEDVVSCDPSLREFGLDDYAMSWLLVHFLQHGRSGNHRLPFKNYCKAMLASAREGPGAWSSLLEHLRIKEPGKLQREMMEHARRLKFETPLPFLRRAVERLNARDDAGARTALDEAGRLAGDDPREILRVARLYRHVPEGEGIARTMLARALDLDPLDARVRVEWMRHLSSAERAPQVELVRRLGDGDPRVLGPCARILYEEDLGGSHLFEEADRERARAALSMAIEAVAAEPDAVDMDTVAALMLASGRPEDARGFARRAVAEEPGNVEFVGRAMGIATVLGQPLDFMTTIAGFDRAVAGGGGADGGGAVPPPAEERIIPLSIAFEVASRWKRVETLDKFLDSLYGRGASPVSGPEWALRVGVAAGTKQGEKALILLRQGLLQFPDSPELGRLGDTGGASRGGAAPGAGPGGRRSTVRRPVFRRTGAPQHGIPRGSHGSLGRV